MVRPPKNIVLLSDGTGNSSAKLMKTNVWRLYQALDVSTGIDQIALYDNGVGTSSFKPLALLGGALGWGLKRNVRTLYKFACRNFTPADEGREADRLFAFGFSRGAFTIRVLIGLIQSQGLITNVRGRELERRAKWAYRAYRRQSNPRGGLVRLLRWLRDLTFRAIERRRGLPAYDKAHNTRATISFMGLWDTVDAYGLPIDELTKGWDQWVWPLSLPQQPRIDDIEKVCHAIALDDERHTFHPVLLDERTQEAAAHTDSEKVTQVWFSGVHSNVGGGYPDDSLAHVPLQWMAREAQKKGLLLHPYGLAEWEARTDPYGPSHDSRRGLGAYYRYNPRSIQKLTNDRFAKVTIKRPKIHETVFQRISGGRFDYAPIVLPEKYAIVTGSGALLEEDTNPYEHPTQAQSRCADQERVWNLVWWRRLTYFSTIGVSLLLLTLPLFSDGRTLAILDRNSRALSGVVELLGQFLPGMLSPWVEYYQRNPFELAAGAIVLFILLSASTWLQRSLTDRMRAIWNTAIQMGPNPVVPSSEPTDLVYMLRSHRLYRSVFAALTQRVLPFVFGVGALAAVVWVIAGTANRAVFALASAGGATCPETQLQFPWAFEFDIRELCHSTGIHLEAGTPYRVRVSLKGGEWFDGDGAYRVTSPAGFGSGINPRVFVPGLPFRRLLTAQWFVPVARIGSKGAEYHTLHQPVTDFTPRRSGQLFVFVNDAIGVGPWLKSLYGNNRGTAIVTVEKLAAAP